MRFINPFARKPDTTHYSIVDVGHTTIKTMIARFQQSGPIFLGCGLVETTGHDILGGRAEAESIVPLLDQALTIAEDNTESHSGHKIVPDEIVFVLPARATLGQLFIVDLIRKKPLTRLTEKEVAQSRRKAEKLARQELQQLTARKGHWEPLHLTDSGQLLDNETVVTLTGRIGRKLTFLFWGTSAETTILRSLTFLAEQLNLTVATMIAPALALTTLIVQPQALILDVGATGTAYYLVQNGVLTATNWHSLGGEFFSQSLTEAAQISLPVAQSLKHDLSKGCLTRQEVIWVNKNLDQARYRWYETTMTVLAELSPDKPLPRDIYLTGAGSRLAGLPKLLRVDPTPFDCAPEIRLLGQFGAPKIKQFATNSFDYTDFSMVIGAAIQLYHEGVVGV